MLRFPVVTQGRDTCGGTKGGSCFFTISQDICVAVPVEFGAVATVGDTFVTCNGASEDDICTGCEQVPDLPEPIPTPDLNPTPEVPAV